MRVQWTNRIQTGRTTSVVLESDSFEDERILGEVIHIFMNHSGRLQITRKLDDSNESITTTYVLGKNEDEDFQD